MSDFWSMEALPAPIRFETEAEDYAEREAIVAVDLEGTPEEVNRDASRIAHRCGYSHGGEVTILVASERVAKMWRQDQLVWNGTAYPDVYWWRVRRVEVQDLEGLAAELERVAAYGRACVVRGRPLAEYGDNWTRRLVHRCPKTGDAPTFESYRDGLRWICVDIDGIPTDIDPRRDPDGYADAARQALPEELAGGRAFYQLSASAGVKPGARVHLWFWLERRAHDDALRAWADEHDDIDSALFGAVQPHYVVPPLFVGPNPDPEEWGEVTMPDILPQRTGWLRGTAEVWPRGLMGVAKWRAHQELLVEEQERRKRIVSNRAESMWSSYRASPRGLEKRAAAALRASIDDIMTASPGDRNTTICRRANFMGRIVSRGGITLDTARVEIGRAAESVLGSEWPQRSSTVRAAIERCLESGMQAGDLDG